MILMAGLQLMKFLCVECDEPMKLTDTKGLDDGSMTVVFSCPECDRKIAMLTNQFETEFVSKIGVQMGGTAAENQSPMGVLAGALAQGKDELKKAAPSDEEFEWTDEAKVRIQKVPFFVRNMAKKTVMNYAKERGITVIDGKLMDEVREKVGM